MKKSNNTASELLTNKYTNMKKEKNSNLQNEKIIQKALRIGGFVIPQTPDEVEDYEKQFGNTEIILPDRLKNLDFMDSNVAEVIPKEKQKIASRPTIAMAAREGSELPQEILDRMKLDRAALKGKTKK